MKNHKIMMVKKAENIKERRNRKKEERRNVINKCVIFWVYRQEGRSKRKKKGETKVCMFVRVCLNGCYKTQ